MNRHLGDAAGERAEADDLADRTSSPCPVVTS